MRFILDGIDITQIDPSEVRENIGYVAQEPWLIAGTIEQNITLGAANISTEEMLLAARLSGVADFIDRHPKGYKLMVKERGEGISGGSANRLRLRVHWFANPPSCCLMSQRAPWMRVQSVFLLKV